MKAILRKPFFWLTLQLAVTFCALAWTGGLEYTRVADTLSYLNVADAGSWTEALSHHRTVGYPLFLRAVMTFGRWLNPLTELQILLYFGSLYLFWHAVKRFSGSAWLAWAAVVPLPWAGVMTLATFVQPDFLAAAAAIVAVSCLFLLAAAPARVGWWIGLGVATFCAYQLRPAAVFLVAFLPVLGAVLKWLHGDRGWKRLWRWTAVACLVTFLPFLAFCGLRWATVGHFGVVSFGGPNQAGMAASFLDGRVVRELPQEHQRLARNMLRKRRQRGWKTMQRRSNTLDYFVQYSDNIWRVAIPVAQQEYKRLSALPEGHPQRVDGMERPARVVQNEMLSRASKAIVRLRPGLYVKWVTSALVYGLKQLLNYFWNVAPALLILFSTPIFLLATRSTDSPTPPLERSVLAALIGLLALGVGYFAAYLLLVSLVSFPFTRYFVSLTLFLPSALCAQLFVMWQRILPSIHPLR
ncbi:MAG: hypothetical protein WBO69_06095 [Thermoanaerobaculia bacterium]